MIKQPKIQCSVNKFLPANSLSIRLVISVFTRRKVTPADDMALHLGVACIRTRWNFLNIGYFTVVARKILSGFTRLLMLFRTVLTYLSPKLNRRAMRFTVTCADFVKSSWSTALIVIVVRLVLSVRRTVTRSMFWESFTSPSLAFGRNANLPPMVIE